MEEEVSQAQEQTAPKAPTDRDVEVETVANPKDLIRSKIDEVNEEVDVAGEDLAKKTEIFKDNGKKWLFLSDHPELLTKEELAGGKPTQIEYNGELHTVESVTIKDEGTYTCRLKGTDRDVEFSKDTVRNILLVEGKAHIVTLFDNDQKDAVEEYIDSLNSKEKPPEDKVQKQQNVQEQSQENILSLHRKSFEEQFRLAQERGNIPKEQMEQMEQTFIMLRLAEEAKGDAGAILKHLALKNLQDHHGIQGLEVVASNLKAKAEEAIDTVHNFISKSDETMANEFSRASKEGKLEDMIRLGKLFKVEGMRNLLFGKDMTEKKLKEVLQIDKKKKWNNLLLLALIIMLIGPVELGKEAVPLSK